jgi:hypothetical protein
MHLLVTSPELNFLLHLGNYNRLLSRGWDAEWD